MLHQKHESYKYVLKNWVDWIITRRQKNVTTSKMHILRRSAQKIKKKHTCLLMTTFYNFTPKIETSWVKKVVKPNLETWNANDNIVFICFIYSRIKK